MVLKLLERSSGQRCRRRQLLGKALKKIVGLKRGYRGGKKKTVEQQAAEEETSTELGISDHSTSTFFYCGPQQQMSPSFEQELEDMQELAGDQEPEVLISTFQAGLLCETSISEEEETLDGSSHGYEVVLNEFEERRRCCDNHVRLRDPIGEELRDEPPVEDEDKPYHAREEEDEFFDALGLQQGMELIKEEDDVKSFADEEETSCDDATTIMSTRMSLSSRYQKEKSSLAAMTCYSTYPDEEPEESTLLARIQSQEFLLDALCSRPHCRSSSKDFQRKNHATRSLNSIVRDLFGPERARSLRTFMRKGKRLLRTRSNYNKKILPLVVALKRKIRRRLSRHEAKAVLLLAAAIVVMLLLNCTPA